MNKDLENKILKYLKKEYNNEIEIYADYQDFNDIEYLLKDIESIEDFEDKLIEGYEESYFYYRKEIENDIQNNFELDEEEIDDLYCLLDEAIEVIYPLKDFLKHKIKIDLLCDFYNEQNYDFTSNGWLRWLVNNQGYKMKDLKTNTDSKFLKSVKSELYNSFSHMNALTILLEVSVKDYFKLKEGNFKSIAIDKSVMLGMFDAWQGSGSDLGIELEKDLTINKKNVNIILLEGKPKEKFNYTVNDVYGLIGSCWRDGYKLN